MHLSSYQTARFAGAKFQNVLGGNSRDLDKGFVGEKGLMRSDQHVRKCQQAAKLVIWQHLAEKVLEANPFLLLINVERHAAPMPALPRVNQRGRVNEFSPAGIDKNRPLWGPLAKKDSGACGGFLVTAPCHALALSSPAQRLRCAGLARARPGGRLRLGGL